MQIRKLIHAYFFYVLNLLTFKTKLLIYTWYHNSRFLKFNSAFNIVQLSQMHWILYTFFVNCCEVHWKNREILFTSSDMQNKHCYKELNLHLIRFIPIDKYKKMAYLIRIIYHVLNRLWNYYSFSSIFEMHTIAIVWFISFYRIVLWLSKW